MEENRNKIIVGAIIGIVVIGVIVLIATRGSVSCDLIEEKPLKADPANLKNLKTSDNKYMANFDGYLKYEVKDDKDKKVYLPLELQSIEVKNFDTVKNTGLVLQTNCAKITLAYNTEGDTKTIKTFTLDLSTPNYDLKTQCIANDVNIVVSGNDDHHYKCNLEKSYTCTYQKNKQETKLATLVVNSLEFELEGNEENIKDGKFSNKVVQCKA